MRCPQCFAIDYTKNRFSASGKQQYICRQCGRNYTQETPRGKAPTLKVKALQLYLDGMNFSAIGRKLHISKSSAANWVRDCPDWVISALRKGQLTTK